MASEAKVRAAKEAANIIVKKLKPGMRLGVGTGSTVRLVVDYLLSIPNAKQLLREIEVYVSSLDTLLYLQEKGVNAKQVLPRGGLDLYFDGADEVAIHAGMCQAVKGRGAAMTREKILAYASHYSILVVDESKISKNLGDKGKPVPVEVLQPALSILLDTLDSYGVETALRTCDCRDGPALTDNNGIVVDTWPWGRLEPLRYEGILDTIPGVIGHGLFIGYFDTVIVGYQDDSAIYECKRTRKPRTPKAKEAT